MPRFRIAAATIIALALVASGPFTTSASVDRVDRGAHSTVPNRQNGPLVFDHY